MNDEERLQASVLTQYLHDLATRVALVMPLLAPSALFLALPDRLPRQTTWLQGRATRDGAHGICDPRASPLAERLVQPRDLGRDWLGLSSDIVNTTRESCLET